jgi:hypothetical protein
MSIIITVIVLLIKVKSEVPAALIPALETPGFTTGGLIVIFLSYHTVMKRMY